MSHAYSSIDLQESGDIRLDQPLDLKEASEASAAPRNAEGMAISMEEEGMPDVEAEEEGEVVEEAEGRAEEEVAGEAGEGEAAGAGDKETEEVI